MESRTHRFPVSGDTPALEIRNLSGSVTIQAREDVGELVVEIAALDRTAEGQLDRAGLFFTHSRLRVRLPERRLMGTGSYAVSVISPPDADVQVAAGSADTVLRGRLGRADLTSASGDIAAEHCAVLQLRTASGAARIGTVDGRATVASASGDLRVDTVGGGLEARTASGDVVVGEAAGDVSVGTASGDVTIGRVADGTVRVTTVSGDSEVGVAPGLRVWLDVSSVSGRVDSQLTDDDGLAGEDPAQLSVTLRSVSGDQRIRRVATAR